MMLKSSLLSLVVALAATASARTCGLKIAPCPSDQICKPQDPSCVDLNRCLGTCVVPSTYVTKSPTTTYQQCGGHVISPTPCPKKHTCVDDPRKSGCGMACDIPGICVPDNSPDCGGFTGKACPKYSGMECYDSPTDDCDPENGGADCIGMCLFPLKN